MTDKCAIRGCDNDAGFTHKGYRYCFKCWEHCGLPLEYTSELFKDDLSKQMKKDKVSE